MYRTRLAARTLFLNANKPAFVKRWVSNQNGWQNDKSLNNVASYSLLFAACTSIGCGSAYYWNSSSSRDGLLKYDWLNIFTERKFAMTESAESAVNNTTIEAKEHTNAEESLLRSKISTDLYVRTSDDNTFAIFTGNSNEYLAREVAMILNMQLGRASVGRFSDGEVNIKVLDNVRWKDTYVIQSLSPPVNESLMELLLLVTTLRRASARHITAIIPYFGYTRHNRVPAQNNLDQIDEKGKRPVAAADVAKMLTVAGVDRVVFIDVHHAQVTGFFGRTPVDDLEVAGVAAKYFRLKNLRSPVVVAPDHDAVQRAKKFRDTLLVNGHTDASLAVVVDHRRRGASEEDFDKDFELVGEVKGRDCIIRDDIIESGHRVVNAAEKLKRAGANRVFAFTTHPLLTDEAFDAIEECSPLVEVVCCNTVPLKRMSDKVRQLSVGMLLAETVRRINENESVSAMFTEKKKQ